MIGKKISLKKDDAGNERTRPWTDELTHQEERKRFDQYLESFAKRDPSLGRTGNDPIADGRRRIRSLESYAARSQFDIAYRGTEGESGAQRTDSGSIRGLTPEEFSSIATANQKAHKFGNSVDVLSPKEYDGYQLIVVSDGENTATNSISPTGEVGRGHPYWSYG